MAYLQLVVGLVLLVIGGDGFVRGCVTIARQLNVSTLLIGLTIAAYGTSAPELVVTVQAARIEATGLALGNVVGSNIANILLILALAALIRPIESTPAALRRDGAVMVLATLILVALLATGGAVPWQGVALLLVLVAVVVLLYVTEKRKHDEAARFHESEAAAIEDAPFRPRFAPLYLVVGLVLLAYGSDLFVQGAVAIAHQLGVSETLIGLTLVAVGTSLPELATSGVAAFRGQSQLALGNIMGSNVFNVLGIVGITVLVAPLPIPPDMGVVDIAGLLVSMAALLVFTTMGLRLVRWEALILLALYAGYVALKAGLV